jgi:hypothetical protein
LCSSANAVIAASLSRSLAMTGASSLKNGRFVSVSATMSFSFVSSPLFASRLSTRHSGLTNL